MTNMQDKKKKTNIKLNDLKPKKDAKKPAAAKTAPAAAAKSKAK